MMNIRSGIKLFFVIMILILCTGTLMAGDSEFFVKTMPITKVYLHNDGFRVVYFKTDLSLGVFYVPMEWFGTSARSKAEVIYDTNPSFPYFSIFWKNGEFHHIRLYLEENRMAQSWGDIPNSADLAQEFNVETLDLEF